MTDKAEALLLTEETVGIFAEVTNYTEDRLRYVLEQNAGLRYVLVTGLDPEKHWATWIFMDDHAFRSFWKPVSEINDKDFVEVQRKGP